MVIPRLILSVLVASVCAGCSLEMFAKGGPTGYSERSCVTADASNVGSSDTEPSPAVYVINQGWHTGLMFDTALVLDSLGLVFDEVHNYRWIEIGWGDRDFYQSSGYSSCGGLKAAFFSDASVVHVAATDLEPRVFFKDVEVVKVLVTPSGLEALGQFVKSTLTLTETGASERLGPSLYGHGSFYASGDLFSLKNSCNTWVARGLRIAGCPVDIQVYRASRVMSQLSQLDPVK